MASEELQRAAMLMEEARRDSVSEHARLMNWSKADKMAVDRAMKRLITAWRTADKNAVDRARAIKRSKKRKKALSYAS